MYLVAVGVLGNHIDSELLRGFLRRVAGKGCSLTFFHPVRVFAKSKKCSGVSRQLSLEEFVKTIGPESLRVDCSNFVRRLEKFSREVVPPFYNGLIRVVLHTEYSVPLWCNEAFRNMYFEAIRFLVEHSRSILQGYDHKVLVEVHPGFTDLENCGVKLYGGDVRVICESNLGVERNLRRLKHCLSDFVQKVKTTVGREVGFCLEPRAGSAVYVGGASQYQTLHDHYAAALFAESLGMGLVLDPGQTVKARIGEKDVWDELRQVGSYYADIVEEVHVHSVKARTGSSDRKPRYHVHPSQDELESFAGLIHHILEHRRKPIGVVYEVIGARRDIVINKVQYLLNILNQPDL